MKKTRHTIFAGYTLLCITLLICFALQTAIAGQSSFNAQKKTKNNIFGIHAVGLNSFKEIHELGSSIVRVIISTPVWDMIETKNGVDFSKLDYVVSTLQQSGIDVVFTIMPNSRKWASNKLFQRKKSGMEPTVHADLPEKTDEYKKTLAAIVERYDHDGKEDMPGLLFSIDYYQLVNEWVWQWEGSDKSYEKYLRTSGEFIKRIHPEARIILGGLTGVEFWAIEKHFDHVQNVKLGGMTGDDKPQIMSMEAFSNKMPKQMEKIRRRLEFSLTKLKPHYDIIDLHCYTENYNEMIPAIKLIQHYAPEKELWSMENAGPFYHYTKEKHCQEIIKRYIVAMYHGISKLFWSSYNPTQGWSKNFLNLSLVNNKGDKKAAYHVYKFMAFHFADHRSIKKMNLGPGIEAYEVLKKTGQSLYVIWAENGEAEVVMPFPNYESGERKVRLVSFKETPFGIKKTENQQLLQNGQITFPVNEKPTFVFR